MSDTSKTPKPWPSLPSDEAAERFVETADLSEYDWSRAEPATHAFKAYERQLKTA